MSKVTIKSKHSVSMFESEEHGSWLVDCVVELSDGTRSGAESVNLPADATDDQISAAILALYEKE